MPEFGDRDKMVELLQLAASQERTIIEFQQRGDEIIAMDITDHVDQLEAQTDGD